MTDFETIVTGRGLIEGPRVDGENRFYFSDVHQGGVYRRSPDGEIETIVPKRRGVGGIALHEDGGVVVSGKNICHVKDGVSTVLYENPDTLGFNDIQPDSQGRLYFGDIRYKVFDENAEIIPGHARRLELGGSDTDLYGDVLLTNGMGFSPDGSNFYHSDTRNGHIIVHAISSDDQCVNRQIFAEVKRGRPDGLVVDSQGYVWVACYAGGCAIRFDPNGHLDQHLEVPAQAVTSLHLGGPDLCDLYIASADNTDDPSLKGCVFRTRVEIPGQETPLIKVKI